VTVNSGMARDGGKGVVEFASCVAMKLRSRAEESTDCSPSH
jgi:hypothetical protein